MRQLKVAIGALGTFSCFITLLIYCWHRSFIGDHRLLRPRLKLQSTRRPIMYQYKSDLPMRHVPLDAIYKDRSDEEDSLQDDNKRENGVTVELLPKLTTENFKELCPHLTITPARKSRRICYCTSPMIDTPGCLIPVALVQYQNNRKKKRSCGRRAVFLNKLNDDKIQATIKTQTMKKYLKRSATFHCCYRFISKSNQSGEEGSKIVYTKCKELVDRATIYLETDFIDVKCFEHDKRNTTHLIYNDVYGFTKRIKLQKCVSMDCHNIDRYNILMLGMDSMSLSRFSQTMPRTVTFFKDNYWIGFRGYHKVDDNTFPNFMAALAGMNISTISARCSGKMDQCNGLLIWSKLKKVGYATAYGEDYLRLPDTFSKNYAFKKQPTHHYMRPLFFNSETELNHSLVCAGKESSGKQLLNFALDFAITYRNDSFFGMFWMNSFSHNANSRPNDADIMMENFFNQLTYTGVLKNTFVIFFSDHGMRFGEYRLKVESYYEERMPMLFMWVPFRFKGRHPELYRSIAINQFRLVTPYDLYNTLVYLKKMTTGANATEDVSEGCPNCQNLFEIISENRTCTDVAIHAKWCSCHKLYALDIQDSSGVKSALHVVSYINSKINTIETQRCWVCMNVTLLKIIRIHFYYDHDKSNLHYVVAFVLTPGNMSYEATVTRNGRQWNLVGPVSIISGYRGMGQCTIRHKDRLFCICQKTTKC